MTNAHRRTTSATSPGCGLDRRRRERPRRFCPSLGGRRPRARPGRTRGETGRWSRSKSGPARRGGRRACSARSAPPRARSCSNAARLRGRPRLPVLREPAACAACLGMLRLEARQHPVRGLRGAGALRLVRATDFGIARRAPSASRSGPGGVATAPVSLIGSRRPTPAPLEREIVVGGVDALKRRVHRADLVAILHADASPAGRLWIARERVLVTWFEAAAAARPEGRVDHPDRGSERPQRSRPSCRGDPSGSAAPRPRAGPRPGSRWGRRCTRRRRR